MLLGILILHCWEEYLSSVLEPYSPFSILSRGERELTHGSSIIWLVLLTTKGGLCVILLNLWGSKITSGSAVFLVLLQEVDVDVPF